MSGWVFRNYGRIDQLLVASADDMERIDELDEARWAATSAPVEQFQVDAGFLAFLDTDGNKRIRVNEVKAARAWTWRILHNRERLVAGSDVLHLSDLDPADAEATGIAALAQHLLATSGAGGGSITLAEIRRHKTVYVSAFPNGDGVITATQVPEDVRSVLDEVLAATGGAADLSGTQGIRKEDVDAWLAHLADTIAWRGRIQAEADTLLPLGDQTEAAAGLVVRLGHKMDQFFSQCALLALEANARERLTATPDQLAALDISDPVAIDAWLAEAPLAVVNPDSVLPQRASRR